MGSSIEFSADALTQSWVQALSLVLISLVPWPNFSLTLTVMGSSIEFSANVMGSSIEINANAPTQSWVQAFEFSVESTSISTTRSACFSNSLTTCSIKSHASKMLQALQHKHIYICQKQSCNRVVCGVLRCWKLYFYDLYKEIIQQIHDEINYIISLGINCTF